MHVSSCSSVYFLTVAVILSYGNAAKILGLFPHTGRSHFMVFEPYLQTLAERGHQITVVSFFPLKNPPENYTDISLQGMSPLGLEVVDIEEMDSANGLLKTLGIKRIMDHMQTFNTLDDIALEVCNKVMDFQQFADAMKQKYDLVIMEYFHSDCFLGLLHVYGVDAPLIAVSSTGFIPWLPSRMGVTDNPAYVPSITAFFTSQMNFWQRMENTYLHLYHHYWFRSNVQIKEQAMIEKHFGRMIPDLADLAKNVSLILLNTHHSLNGVKPLVPGVVEVGGMHLNSAKKPIPNYLQRFINESQHGVVLLSFGSLIKTATLPAYKEEMIINACAKLKQRVIWKYENSGVEGTLTGNILKVRWIPQYELLQHPNVLAFVAHGGLLGMTEAVSAGKPMVVIPFFGDQPNNAAAAEAVGLAQVVSYDELTEKALAEAMQKAVSAEMRLNARKVSKMWKDRLADPLDTAIYWTERVIRWGKQDPLHSSSRDLSFIELALLDVAAAFILAVIVLLIVLRFILSLVPKIFGFGSKKQKLH